MVRISLVDDEANVRSGAAKAFDILQEQVGAKAIDQTIPTLLEALRQPGQSSGTALQALREVMSVSNRLVDLITLLTNIPGSRIDCVPCPHTNLDCFAYDRVQCPCASFFSHCRWKRFEQKTQCDIECSRQGA